MSPSGTPLGMPSLPPPGEPTWKQAWDAALYGPRGFLRRHPPALDRDPAALVALVAAEAPEAVVLLGSAGILAPAVAAALPGADVRFDLPDAFDGVVLAVDWLCHVPAHVVAVDEAGYPRFVHVDPVSGRERLGSRLNETSVPQSIGLWLTEWWPVAEGGPGARAEVGTGRDAAWRDVCRRLAGGTALAVERGHTAAARPRGGSLRCPSASPDRVPVPDGERDLVADVALDAVAAATGGRVVLDGELTRVVSR
ncbi:hypothetical protein [Nocardioides perillae]|uniref:Uncharacterized protein n=1 Tax=Nocardioides perillae TaxID=1119534 RepID=A0A7Y9UKW6_9ACTN|nr:hypothetical protein [Nocardioides perillae]NYG53816.1 hypothetical protein [Nocardioides perillae]